MLLRGMGHRNALAVTDTLTQLLSTIGSAVHVDNALHTGSTLKGLINGAELSEVEVGVKLILYLIGQVEILINLISHNF
jgi:hypothetical protein